MIRAVALLVLAVSPLALAQGYDIGGASASAGAGVAPVLAERDLYGSVPFEQFSAGYGAPPGPAVERVDEPLQVLPDQVQQAAPQDSVSETQFPDSNINNRFDTTKEIHSSTLQRRITNQFNRNLRRYYKTLNVNALYNTNIARIRHAKLVNVLNVQSQDTHRPVLRVAFNRQDTVTNLGDRDDAPIVENQASSNVLPPQIEPVQVQRIGYDGQPQQPGVGLRCFNCGGGGNGGYGEAAVDNRYTSEYPNK